ncbi:hypothetical protein L6261_03220 [Candidatus Parcubacteria bacterium]|nr:hypothetical protein [Candidatus Parcubacteria bacterium]
MGKGDKRLKGGTIKMEYNKFGKSKYDRNNFRVRSPIKSFRDLEVYQTTIKLSNLLLELSFSAKEKDEIKKMSEDIPRLIAESYGDKFDSFEIAEKKLNQSITLITNIITKLDILKEKSVETKEEKDILDKLIIKYGYQKLKVLNLRRAWERIFDKKEEEK